MPNYTVWKTKNASGKNSVIPCSWGSPNFEIHEYKTKNEKIDNGNFVFSEDEYHSEYADPYRWSNLTQIGMLSRHKGLFVGLSMQDPNLRRLIDVTHRQYPEIWNYAILQRERKLPSEDSKSTILRNLAEYVEEDSFKKIGVKVIWVNDIKTEVAPILNKISALPE